MTVNRPVGDNARKGAVLASGQFMDQKKSATAKPSKACVGNRPIEPR
jgi:hypothetical protein